MFDRQQYLLSLLHYLLTKEPNDQNDKLVESIKKLFFSKEINRVLLGLKYFESYQKLYIC